MANEVKTLKARDFLSLINIDNYAQYLNKGTLVMINLNAVFSVCASSQRIFIPQELPNDFQYLKTLLRYEGGGKFFEFYTGEVLQFAPVLESSKDSLDYHGFVAEYSFRNKFGIFSKFSLQEFMDKCSYILENPLFFNNICMICNDDNAIQNAKQYLIKQFDSQEEIIKKITGFKDQALENFTKSYESCKSLFIIDEQIKRFQNGICLSRNLKDKVNQEENAE